MARGILTVLTEAPDRLLATGDDVRAELGQGTEPVDAVLTPRILQASAAIASACGGRVFGRETVREVFRISGPAAGLILARAPVTAVASLSERSNALVEGDDFEIDAEAGIAYRLAGDCRVPWCAGKVTVEYTGGWLLPSQPNPNLPSDLRGLCIERVVRGWNSKGRDTSVRSESTDGVDAMSYFDPDKLSTEETNGLRGYRRVSL